MFIENCLVRYSIGKDVLDLEGDVKSKQITKGWEEI